MEDRKLAKLIAMSNGKTDQEADALLASIFGPDIGVGEIDNTGSQAVADHDAVQAYLLSLENTNAALFEVMRKKPYSEQKAAAGV